MSIRRLHAYQTPTKPLRFRINASLKPILALKIYLALIIAQGLFEYFFMWTLGLSFFGLQSRMLLLGVMILVGFTSIYLIQTKKHELSKKDNNVLILFLLYGFLAISISIGVYLGIINANEGMWDYTRSIVILLIVALFSYLVVESDQSTHNVIWTFILACAMMATLEVISQLISWRIVDWPFLFSNFRWIFAIAGSYFLTRYFLMHSKMWSNLFIFIIISASLTLDIDKPLVISYFMSMTFITIASLIIVVCGKSNKKRQFWTRLFTLIIFVIFSIIMLEIIVPGNLLYEYWMEIMLRFLKINPVTGRVIGTVDGGRFYLYQKSYEMFQSKPIWGYGLGIDIKTNIGTHVPTHNIIADFILGTGIVGFIQFILICAISGYIMIKKMNYYRYSELKLGLLGYIVFVAFFSMVGVLWTHVIMVHMLAIALGVGLKLAVLDARTSAAGEPIKIDHVLKSPGA